MIIVFKSNMYAYFVKKRSFNIGLYTSCYLYRQSSWFCTPIQSRKSDGSYLFRPAIRNCVILQNKQEPHSGNELNRSRHIRTVFCIAEISTTVLGINPYCKDGPRNVLYVFKPYSLCYTFPGAE